MFSWLSYKSLNLDQLLKKSPLELVLILFVKLKTKKGQLIQPQKMQLASKPSITNKYIN